MRLKKNCSEFAFSKQLHELLVESSHKNDFKKSTYSFMPQSFRAILF
jgi:hypothetical protein